jgi:hypothetical protein
MHLAASLPCRFLDFRPMKIFTATVLVLLITFTPCLGMGSVSGEEERAPPENISSILSKNADLGGNERAPVVSALDLSLFGIISLGVLGLFWIRRHTSEL